VLRRLTPYIIQCTCALRLAYTTFLQLCTHASDLGRLGPELGLIDLDALPGGALAAGLLHGAEAALPPHLAVPVVAQLLLAGLPAAAAPCTHTSTEEHSRFVGQFLAIYAVSIVVVL